MNFTHITWEDGITPVDASNMNRIETGLSDAASDLDSVNIFALGNAITGGDLNDYTTAGRYYCANSSTADSIENTPRRAALQLLVIPCGQADRLVQLAFTNTASPGYIYSRMYNSNGWSDWTTIA